MEINYDTPDDYRIRAPTTETVDSRSIPGWVKPRL